MYKIFVSAQINNKKIMGEERLVIGFSDGLNNLHWIQSNVSRFRGHIGKSCKTTGAANAKSYSD